MKCFDSWVTKALKSLPTIQCHVGPYFWSKKVLTCLDISFSSVFVSRAAATTVKASCFISPWTPWSSTMRTRFKWIYRRDGWLTVTNHFRFRSSYPCVWVWHRMKVRVMRRCIASLNKGCFSMIQFLWNGTKSRKPEIPRIFLLYATGLIVVRSMNITVRKTYLIQRSTANQSRVCSLFPDSYSGGSSSKQRCIQVFHRSSYLKSSNLFFLESYRFNTS